MLRKQVTVVRGSAKGLIGEIARIDEMTGWIYIRPIPVDPDPARREFLEGPFTRSELEFEVNKP